MDHRQVGHHWNRNAEVWTRLVRAGYDVYRDFLNTPAFLSLLPEVRGLSGLDIGCGEGHNTRLLAKRGARMAAVDISDVFIRYATKLEEDEPQGISYQVASAVELPFADNTFEFATGFMSFMDIPEIEQVFADTRRVLKPGGFMQFSITHPCYDTPYRRNLRNEQGQTYAYEVGDYFRTLDGEITEWHFSAAPAELIEGLPMFMVPRFTRTLSQWLNLVIDSGFILEHFEEPCPSDEAVSQCPNIQDAQVIPFFLHIRARKPGSPEQLAAVPEAFEQVDVHTQSATGLGQGGDA
jgi:ubiquinone/menaquinone biosynthesis C-methylase UbiE